MDKYKKTAERRLKKDEHPEHRSRRMLEEARLSSAARDEFFDEAFGDILCDYFDAWLRTEPHETKAREHLYACAMSLGSVKEKLAQYETRGKNVPLIG